MTQQGRQVRGGQRRPPCRLHPNALGQRIRTDVRGRRQRAEVVERWVDALGRLEAVFGTDEAEATHFTYDATGNEQTVTDALGHVTTQAYDGLNRLRQTDVLDAADPTTPASLRLRRRTTWRRSATRASASRRMRTAVSMN